MSTRLIDKILSEVSLDPRIHDGIFSLEENDHMDILREYLVSRGIDESSVIEFCNKVLEGKYPERQAYNKNGILVTFPTPEYKKNAIAAGTHFEQDPTKGMSNLFQTPGGASKKKEEEPPAEEPKAKGAAKTQLPVSQAPPSQTEPQAAEPQAQTTSAPMPTPEPQAAPAPTEPTELPPPPQKSPKEKYADKEAIKALLKGDDYMLERFSTFIAENAERLPGDLLEHIRCRI